MRNARLVQHGEKQVGHRCALRIADMRAALDAADTAGDEQKRQVGIEMQVRIAQTGPVQDHRVIEQRAVAVLRVAQLAEVVGQHPRVQPVDLRGLLLLLGIAR